MSSRGFEELWRKALELNVRYYTSLGKLTVEYLSDLAGAMSAQTAARTETHGAAQPGPQAACAPPAAAKPAAAEAVMMLEGEAGSTALGVFLVGNSFPNEVSATVSSSPMTDESGRPAKVAFVFDPPVIALRAGEQLLVRVSAVIDPSLEPGVRYRGEFSIPELRGTRIPVIVKRRSTEAKVEA
jgi:hypothetical protein